MEAVHEVEALPTAEVAHEVEVPMVVDAVEDSHNTSITEPLKKTL